MPVRTAVIGGGPLGLMMLKNLKHDGFDVTLYESRSWVGGLWKYSKDESLSTAENTVFNSSKYRTAISDFPVPESMADFPPAEQLHEYLESYCDHFDLWPHIKLNSPVKTIRRQDDQWVLEIGKETDSWSEAFDKVALSCGSFIKPRQPDFKDIDKFQGKTLHAINYHNHSQFKGKRVLIVGLHASAQDVVSSLSKYASHVYLSHRSGLVMVSRSLHFRYTGLSGPVVLFSYERLKFGCNEGLHESFMPINLSEKAPYLPRCAILITRDSYLDIRAMARFTIACKSSMVKIPLRHIC